MYSLTVAVTSHPKIEWLKTATIHSLMVSVGNLEAMAGKVGLCLMCLRVWLGDILSWPLDPGPVSREPFQNLQAMPQPTHTSVAAYCQSWGCRQGHRW